MASDPRFSCRSEPMRKTYYAPADISVSLDMVNLVEALNCPHCGAPLDLGPGEIIVTCRYCGSDIRIAGEKKFLLKHSMVATTYQEDEIRRVISSWMAGGAFRPDDLARASRIDGLECVYLPFYVFEVDAFTTWRGVLSRTGQPYEKSGDLRKDYFWKILGRRSSPFPTREYRLPLTAKTTFDMSQMVRNSKFLNAEIDEDEAKRLVEEEVTDHQKRLLLQEEVDDIIEAKTEVDVKDTEFVHAPIWFVRYSYKKKLYEMTVDGASADVIKADVPPPSTGFGGLF